MPCGMALPPGPREVSGVSLKQWAIWHSGNKSSPGPEDLELRESKAAHEMYLIDYYFVLGRISFGVRHSCHFFSCGNLGLVYPL